MRLGCVQEQDAHKNRILPERPPNRPQIRAPPSCHCTPSLPSHCDQDLALFSLLLPLLERLDISYCLSFCILFYPNLAHFPWKCSLKHLFFSISGWGNLTWGGGLVASPKWASASRLAQQSSIGPRHCLQTTSHKTPSCLPCPLCSFTHWRGFSHTHTYTHKKIHNTHNTHIQMHMALW